jgi:autotransporter-associated beta strand protein
MSHIDGDSCSDALMQAYLGKNTLRRSLTRQEYALLQAMGWSLVFDDDIDNMYWVTDDGSIIKRNSDLLNKSIVYVNDNLVVSPASSSETISLSQLKGTDTSVTLSILTPDDGGTASVDFYNPSGKDSEYAGRVEANTASLSKTGAGKLTLSGNVTSSGTVSVKEGTLVLAGSSVNIANTSISSSLVWSGESANLGKVTMDGGALVSQAASSTESGSPTNALLAEDDQDGEIPTVANRAQSSSSLSASSLSGYGVLDLNGDTLTLTGSEDTAFVAGYSTSGTVAKTGTGTQILAGDGSSDYQLDVDGGVLALMNSDNSSVSYESVSVDNATLYLAPDDSNGSYTSLELAKSATFGANSTLGVEVDDVANAPTAFLTSTEQSTFQGGSNGATIYATASADTSGADSLNMTIASNATVSGGDLSVETDGVLADGFFYTNVKALQVGSDIVLTGTANTSNPYNVAASTTNTKAGANLLWNAHSDIASGTTLAALQEALGDAFADGDTASMSRMLSASVGSTVTGILAAANSAIANEQLRVRERATGIGFNDDRRSHFWIEGIGRFDTLDASGDEAGFEWNSWGGAVGADFKVSDNTVLGLSLTALTGDFSSSASDSADGDMDAEFLSLFARMQSGRWSHTVVLTGGIGSASYDRTVTYPGGRYRTNGDVDTTSFGALYQVAYDVPLNERNTAIFQPLATIAFHTASADDVTEKGAGNANLSVSGMDMSSVEVTLGGRVAGVLMQNATGRDVTGEFRLEVVQSMGDTQAEADVRFAELPGSLAQKVEGAELGSTGIRFGAGISVPVSQQGNVYGNAQAEFRSGSSVVNAAIGFQYSF